MKKNTRLAMLTSLVLALTATTARGEKPFAPVQPALEIEVLDPGVDPNGNPAVRLRDDGFGQMNVDIPPVVLVHRYYYSGDRSFQGPMLPGGPSMSSARPSIASFEHDRLIKRQPPCAVVLADKDAQQNRVGGNQHGYTHLIALKCRASTCPSHTASRHTMTEAPM